LRRDDGKSTGKLHNQLCLGGMMNRDAFEEVLGAMARAGLISLSDATFEKDGKPIPYRRVNLTSFGHSMDEQTPLEFIMKVAMPTSAERKGKKRAVPSAKRKRERKRGQGGRQKVPAVAVHSQSDLRFEEALRGWRMAEARWRGVPAFRIFSDKTLVEIATKRPRTAQELLAISGIGMTTVEKYGHQIYRLVNDSR
jgi:superfamily II DNA helicase RecQ